ncbi:MAG: TIGR00730 family Rossman fold protein [Candidatus Paceibacterota bacterium]
MLGKNKKEKKRKINVPSAHTAGEQISMEDLDHDLRVRIDRIQDEFIEGFNFIRKHPRSVTFFGSARFTEENEHYKKAQELALMLGDEGFDVITGGGPGIMEAANRGAKDNVGGGKSLGINIELPYEQILNPYVDEHISFYYFFTRKVLLTFSAEAYIYFPGGYGTLDEFFEILTLKQTKKISDVPIICVDKHFWGHLDSFIQTTLRGEFKTIDEKDPRLYTITDDLEEVVEIVKAAPLRQE